jgi:hypothetical protein
MKIKQILYPKDKLSTIIYIEIQSYDFFDGIYEVKVKEKHRDDLTSINLYETALHLYFSKNRPKRLQKLPLP